MGAAIRRVQASALAAQKTGQSSPPCEWRCNFSPFLHESSHEAPCFILQQGIPMKRRNIFQLFWAWLASATVPMSAAAANFPLKKTKAEWRKLVSASAYEVLFEHGTERPGSSPLNAEKRPGTFVCVACNLPLFNAAHKYESGTGWPSFFPSLAQCFGHHHRFQAHLPAHRIPLFALWWAPRPCV
jgi:peptide-methionine (R)-S-oxide reductase